MNKRVFALCLVLISLAGCLFFRFYHRTLPFLDKVAKQQIHVQEYKLVNEAVKEGYPDADLFSQSKITQRLFQERLKSQKGYIGNRIGLRAEKLKSQFHDEKGNLYLSGIDSYYWLRLLRNLLEKGDIGVHVAEGCAYDELLISPAQNAASPKNIHIWLGFLFYKSAYFFNKDIPLENVVFYVPVFLSCVIVVFSFFLSRRLGANDLGAFFASIIVGMSGFLMSRISGEWFDTDIYNVLFPLLIFGVSVYAFGNKNIARRILLSSLSGIFVAFYASTWKGWWFIFDILIIAGLFFVVNQKESQKYTQVKNEEIRRNIISILLFISFSSLFVIAFNGFSVWKDFLIEPLRLLTILKVTPQTLWPNVYLTVAELEPIDSVMLIELLGGKFVFFCGLLGLFYIFIFARGSRDRHIGFGLWCIIFWILGTMHSALEAVRFSLLLVVPFGLAFGLVVTRIYSAVHELSRKYLKRRTALALQYLFISCVSVFILFNTFMNCAKLMVILPAMDDYWFNALTKIEKETPKEAIINSWWDFGHWFKAIGKRRVLFDGMTQNTPYAYWVAGALLTESEDEAVGILRMVNTSDNRATEFLQKSQGMSTAAAVDLTKETLGYSRKEAGTFLRGRLEPRIVDEFLEYLFPQDIPPVYFVVSYDMISKIIPISFIGNWDFDKVDMWFKKKSLSRIDFLSYLIEKYGMTRDAADAKYFELSFLSDKEAEKWFSQTKNYSSGLKGSHRDGKLLFFENGLVVNLANLHAYVVSEYPGKRGVPKSLIFFEDGRLKEEFQEEGNLAFSALLIKEDTDYKSILLDSSLAKSMLVRLYFLGGKGLKHFKLFHKEEDEEGSKIYIYQIIW